MQNLAGKGAVITGAGSGIGLGMARAFARQGMNLMLADIDDQALTEARRQVEQIGVKVTTCRVDVSRRPEMYDLADQTKAAFGRRPCAVQQCRRGPGRQPPGSDNRRSLGLGDGG